MYNGCVKENLTVINGVCADMLALEGFIRCNCNWNDNTLDATIKDVLTKKEVHFTINPKNFEVQINRIYKVLDEIEHCIESETSLVAKSQNGYIIKLEVA